MPKQVTHALGLRKHPHTNLPANPIPPISKTRRKPTDAPSAVVEPRLRRRRPETQAEPEASTDETAEELARLRQEIAQMKAEKAAAQTRLQNELQPDDSQHLVQAPRTHHDPEESLSDDSED